MPKAPGTTVGPRRPPVSFFPPRWSPNNELPYCAIHTLLQSLNATALEKLAGNSSPSFFFFLGSPSRLASEWNERGAPFWDLTVQPQFGDFGPSDIRSRGPLWPRVLWPPRRKCAASEGYVSFARGRGLPRCIILCRYRGIKDVLIALSSLQHHTTHPLAHPPTNIHMCYNVNSFFVIPTCQCQCTTAVAPRSYSIPVGTAFMVPAVPILPPRPATVAVQVYVPVQVPVVCIAAFLRCSMC